MSDARFKFVPGEDLQFLRAPGLRLEFRRSGERWTHSLSVGAGEQALLSVVAVTVEADPTRNDPVRVVSPIYQDVQPHFADGETCALLTGHWIPHHFSAVVTARLDGPSAVFDIDIADRCRAAIDALAATYLIQLGSSDLVEADSRRIVWRGDALGQGRLEFTTGGDIQVALAEAGRQGTLVQALARLVSTTYTQRLFYSWRWTPPV